MESLPIAPACSLEQPELEQQLARYRAVGHGAQVIESGARRRVVRVAPEVPVAVIERLVEIERGCCPFFELVWDRESRTLSVGVGDREHEPALDAIGRALGVKQEIGGP